MAGPVPRSAYSLRRASKVPFCSELVPSIPQEVAIDDVVDRPPQELSKSPAEARRALFHFIEGWYDRKRRHSTLRYLSPAAYEAELQNAA